jgi:hypothetical protein
MKRFARYACAASLFFAATILSAQQKTFDGNWQMDVSKSKVNDGRVVSMTILTVDNGIKITIKTKKGDAPEVVSEFVSKLNGKACEYDEGAHKSQLTVWYDGPTLNACKENGPADDVTSMWKFELSPDSKQIMTMKVSHYEPTAEDELLVFNKK